MDGFANRFCHRSFRYCVRMSVTAEIMYVCLSLEVLHVSGLYETNSKTCKKKFSLNALFDTVSQIIHLAKRDGLDVFLRRCVTFYLLLDRIVKRRKKSKTVWLRVYWFVLGQQVLKFARLY